MHAFLIPLVKGLVAVFTVLGVGKLVLRLASIRNLPWYWNIAFSALAGQAAVNGVVQLVLLSGGGSPFDLRLVAWLFAGAGTAGHLLFPWTGIGRAVRELFRAEKIATAVLFLAVLTNLAVALAPSSKIDELYYHMLTPKRIVEDGRLKFYVLPIESSIVPHMDFQISLSVLHAAGAPDSGNFVSYGYSLALFLFIAGFVTDACENRHLGLLCAVLCSVGLYATVWHTTSGAHSLGDLATVVALAGVLRPSTLIHVLGPNRFTFFLTTSAALAATTKLSLLPLSIVVSFLILFQVSRVSAGWHAVPRLAGLAILPWSILHLPLMIWTFLASGSFWGPVFANVFAPSVFPPTILEYANGLQAFSPGSLGPMIRYALIEFSPVFFIAMAWLLWTAIRGCRTSQIVVGLLLLQAGLVAWKLHFDFRFLGGLEYVVVLAAVLTLTGRERAFAPRDGWASIGRWIAKSSNWILLFAAVPWLGSQIYYARPFAGVVCGLVSPRQFLERYVALTEDFEILDRILPKDAVLYLPGARLPNFYAPRPVVLTPLDLHGRAPIFRLTASPESDIEEINSTSILKCGPTVYSNDHAVIQTYRTPGAVPVIGPIAVKSCEIQRIGAGQ